MTKRDDLNQHGPLARYIKSQVAHALGMPGTFSPPLPVRDPDMHHGTCVTHVPWCMPGSLTSGFLLSRWRGKRSRRSRRMRNPQSGKRPMGIRAWIGNYIHIKLWATGWLLCQKQVSRAGISNYILQYMWDDIICLCPRYMPLVQHSW